MSASEPRRGAYLERQAQAALRADGYWTMKAPGSKGAVDLVAIKPGQVLFIQAKLAGGAYMPPAERAALWDAAQQAGAIPLAMTRSAPGVLAWFRLIAREGPPVAVWELFTIDEVA